MRKPIQYVSYGAKPFGWEWIWTIQALQPTLLNVALRFFPFSQAWYTIARGWLVYITIWFKSFTSSPIFILISFSIISQFLNPIVSSLSLSLSPHTNKHIEKFKTFSNIFRLLFMFGQNHLLLDSSTDQYLSLQLFGRWWYRTFGRK